MSSTSAYAPFGRSGPDARAGAGDSVAARTEPSASPVPAAIVVRAWGMSS
ncbi:hypothetical protein ACFQHO_52585 [Actinomadura yumaensis]